MKPLTIAAVLVLLAAPVFANQCPGDIAAIDAALAEKTDLSEDQRAQVQALRDEGAQQHEAGDHAASMATLAQAKDMLGLN